MPSAHTRLSQRMPKSPADSCSSKPSKRPVWKCSRIGSWLCGRHRVQDGPLRLEIVPLGDEIWRVSNNCISSGRVGLVADLRLRRGWTWRARAHRWQRARLRSGNGARGRAQRPPFRVACRICDACALISISPARWAALAQCVSRPPCADGGRRISSPSVSRRPQLLRMGRNAEGGGWWGNAIARRAGESAVGRSGRRRSGNRRGMRPAG